MSTETIQVVDPAGIVQFETDDIQVAFAKASRLAAPNLNSGTPRWYEAGWRVRNATPEFALGCKCIPYLGHRDDCPRLA